MSLLSATPAPVSPCWLRQVSAACEGELKTLIFSQFHFTSSRNKHGGSTGRRSQATAGFSKVVQLRGPAERNMGSVASHTVRWVRSASMFQALCVFFITPNNVSFFYPRLFHEDHVRSRSHSRAAASAAVIWLRRSVLQLLCSHQRRCFRGAALQVDQHRGSLSVKVPSDSHVIFSRKSELGARFQTWECQSKSRIIFIPLLEFFPSLQMPATPLRLW